MNTPLPSQIRRPRDFGVDIPPDFAELWDDALIDFCPGGKTASAARAVQALFPGENVGGYFKPVRDLLRSGASPREAAEALWAHPIPWTRSPAP